MTSVWSAPPAIIGAGQHNEASDHVSGTVDPVNYKNLSPYDALAADVPAKRVHLFIRPPPDTLHTSNHRSAHKLGADVPTKRNYGYGYPYGFPYGYGYRYPY